MQEQRQTICSFHEERGGLRPHGGLSGAWRGDQVSIAKEPAQEFPAPTQRVAKPILSFRGVPQGYLLRGAKRRGNPQFFSCKFAEKRKNCAILEQIATPVCGLARNDRLFRQPEKNRPPAVLFSLSINPLYGVSGSFTQGELEGAKPASN